MDFTKTFTHPVVVAKPMTLNGDQPAVIRIKNLSSTGFDIRIQEWDYLDGTHVQETVGFIAMEAGSHDLPDGTLVEAGFFEEGGYGPVFFSQAFKKVPVVIAGVNTYNDGQAVTGRISNVSWSGFDYELQEQEASYGGHTNETVGYIAWETSSGLSEDFRYEVGRTGEAVTDGFSTISFSQAFEDAPVFAADMQTCNGPDTANIRMGTKDAGGVEIRISEEESLDSETDHIPEVVGYIALH